jgi:hypothetical protein
MVPMKALLPHPTQSLIRLFIHVNTDAIHLTAEIHRLSIYFGNHRKVSVPLHVFIGLSSPRRVSYNLKSIMFSITSN